MLYHKPNPAGQPAYREEITYAGANAAAGRSTLMPRPNAFEDINARLSKANAILGDLTRNAHGIAERVFDAVPMPGEGGADQKPCPEDHPGAAEQTRAWIDCLDASLADLSRALERLSRL